jgi:cyclophilin family peptidyl-prolyl cis-trans isomerase
VFVGTPKRERQKANRQIRLEEIARQARTEKRKRTGMYLALIPLVAVAIVGIVWLTNRGNDSVASPGSSTSVDPLAPFTSADPNAPTTTVDPLAPTTSADPNAPVTVAAAATTLPLPTTIAPAAAVTGDTPCPAADGSAARTISFAKTPPMCIDAAKKYSAAVTTNKGAFTIEFDAKAAPITVNNFVVLARYHYFDNTICHRILQDFVAQCGDPTGTGGGGPGYTIADELPAQGAYKVGSLAMANTGQPNTGGSQLFIITGAGGAALPPSYSLFGQVTDGLDTTVKAIAAAAAPADPQPPLEQIVIQSVVITEK